MEEIILLMVVEVSKDKRIRCDYKNCNHGVYKRIHVVCFEDGHYECLGSSCYKKLTGQSNVNIQVDRSVGYIGEGKVLTDEERGQLIANKALLLESLTYSPPDEFEPVVVTQMNHEKNYQLLKEYKKFNPEINYSIFPKAEKRSRALDMVNRRYRDLGMTINDQSYSYKNEIRVLMDDMVDTFQKADVFLQGKNMNLNQAVKYVEENKITIDSKNVFVVGVDYKESYFEIYDLVFSEDDENYSKFILGLEGGKIHDHMAEGVEDSYHGETYEELLLNIGNNVRPSVKFRIYNSNDYVGYMAAYALKKLFPSLPNPDDANDSVDFKNKAIYLINKINGPLCH